MNGLPGDWRQTAIMPMTVSRAISGATMSRSSSSRSVPGTSTARASAQHVVHDLGPPLDRGAADDPLAEQDGVGADLVRDRCRVAAIALNDAPSGSARNTALVSASSRTRDRSVIWSRTAPEVERRGDVAGDVGEGRHLVGPAAGVAIELGVLDRDADARRDRPQQPDVRRPEPALDLHALDADHADRLVAEHDRDAQERLDRRAHGARLEPVEVLVAVEEQRLARPDDVRGQALAEGEPLPAARSCRLRCSRRTRSGRSRVSCIAT